MIYIVRKDDLAQLVKASYALKDAVLSMAQQKNRFRIKSKQPRWLAGAVDSGEQKE